MKVLELSHIFTFKMKNSRLHNTHTHTQTHAYIHVVCKGLFHKEFAEDQKYAITITEASIVIIITLYYTHTDKDHTKPYIIPHHAINVTCVGTLKFNDLNQCQIMSSFDFLLQHKILLYLNFLFTLLITAAFTYNSSRAQCIINV